MIKDSIKEIIFLETQNINYILNEKDASKPDLINFYELDVDKIIDYIDIYEEEIGKFKDDKYVNDYELNKKISDIFYNIKEENDMKDTLESSIAHYIFMRRGDALKDKFISFKTTDFYIGDFLYYVSKDSFSDKSGYRKFINLKYENGEMISREPIRKWKEQ